MKKTVIIIIFFILYISSFVSAQYANLQVKEAFDKARKWYSENYGDWDKVDIPIPNDPHEPERLQEYKGFAEAIQSHITMYRITRDKAHLIKSINIGLKLVSKRTDVIDNVSGTPQIWADYIKYPDEKIGYWYEGFVLAALAELAYIMIAEPVYSSELVNLSLPVVQLITNPMPNAPLPLVPMTTYGAIGSWFRDRVNETMTYYGTVQWADDAGFLYGNIESKECNSNFYHRGLEAVNQHAPFTVAAMYLKAIDPTSSTSSIPGKIKDFYLGNVSVFEDGNDCDPNNLIDNNFECQNLPVMHLDVNKNAYWWFYHGWSRKLIQPQNNSCANDCRRPCGDLTEFLEDFGHADFTMEFPIHAIPFGYFSDGHMIRWRNTFTKSFWDENLNGFHSSVLGTDYDFSNNLNCQESVFNCYFFVRENPLLFAPLYKFDGADATATSPNVYDILMNFYNNTVYPALTYINGNPDPTFFSNRTIYGLSRLVAAQWDKECTNNTLYNRDVVYDQDFSAKNILTIAPQQTTDVFYTKDNSGNPSPFADPETFTDGGPKDRFIIESGTTVNMTAGERIVVKSGSSAKLGSKFHAYIDPDLATECAMRVQNTQNKTHSNSVVASVPPNAFSDKQKTNSSSTPSQFSINPNPSTGLFSLQLSENTPSQVFIYNSLGEVVYQSSTINNQSSIDLSSHPRGIYFIKLISEGNIYTEKIIIQ